MSPAEVAAELDAELLRRMWALFDAAKAMCQGGEWEPEVWERLIRAVADVPESARGAALRAEPSEEEVERAALLKIAALDYTGAATNCAAYEAVTIARAALSAARSRP